MRGEGRGRDKGARGGTLDSRPASSLLAAAEETDATRLAGRFADGEGGEAAEGVELPADFIKDAMKGAGYVGVTTLADLAAFLTRRCEVPSDLTGPGDATTLLRPVVEGAITQGYPVIVLFSGNGVDLAETVGHFMVVVGVDDAGVVCADPWGGKMRSLDWGTFERLQRLGQALVVKRRRDDQLPAW